MASIRMLAISIGCSTLLHVSAWPSTPASAQVVERGVEGAAVGAIIGGIVGGGRGAATGAAIGGGVGVLSGAAEANARAQGYYGPPPGYGPPPPGYYGPPPPRYYRPPHAGYYGPPRAAVAVSIITAPPPLPVYEQPLCPGPGYIWTPGYWAYAGDYYWVPGTWVLPPVVGLVWTPGYWGYDGQRYVWNAGYWGPHVGYYGGINYGFGYSGSGYEGGYWDNGVFFYNSAVTKVDTALITHTYNKTVVNTATVNNVSFNGSGGTTVQPTAEELTWSQEKHASPTALQVKHQRAAGTNRALFASVNHGTPLIAATAKPAVFKGPETVGPKVVAGSNPTGKPGATDQGSVDGPKNGTDQKRLPEPTQGM
jgi:WXXGXW repeat (2 copies)